MTSLYIYFMPTLTSDEIENDNIGRKFRTGLVSLTEGGVQKLKLRDKYVLVRNNLPSAAATVGKLFWTMVQIDYNNFITIYLKLLYPILFYNKLNKL